jgi:xylan 1,4-beta-xylosidase
MIDDKDTDTVAPIEKAILTGDLIRLKKILIKDPTCIDWTTKEGIPMSFLAASMGRFEMVKYIVEYSRASMNTLDHKNRNILHYAVASGQLDLVVYLVEKVGMSITAPDNKLVTPYQLAYRMKYIDLLKYFETICGAAYTDMYHNPIRTGMFPDPSIVRVGEDYYMVNSSFIFFPCIPISHSKDLIHWKIIGHAITNPQWAQLDDLEGGRGYWAPDISYYHGKFTITATYRLNDTGTVYRKQIIVHSDKPEGPYSQPAIIDEDGIDPSIFNDEDGKRYMLLNRGARILELNAEATMQIGEARLLFYGDQKRAPEGPHLLKKDGYYYLFLAEGGTGPGHRITVARATSLFGKYEACPYNPIMRQEDEIAALQRCGHGKPVMTQHGEWYMVYLCGRMIGEGYSILGRETALDPITWTADSWPLVNHLKGPSALQVKPKLQELIFHNQDEDNFDEPHLGFEWLFPRPPEKNGYKLRDNRLWLKGSRFPLCQREARNILLRRQKNFIFEAKTSLSINELSIQQDAGMIAYYDENTWLKFGVFADDTGVRSLKVMEHIGSDTREVNKSVHIPKKVNSVHLWMKTEYLQRDFYYSFDGEDYHFITSLENVYYLSDEGLKQGKRFTGAMIGLYAYAGESELYVPFDFFQYITDETMSKH